MSPDKGKGRSASTRRGQQARAAAPAAQPSSTDDRPSGDWTVRPVSEQVHKQWLEAVAAEPELMAAELSRLRTRPLDRSANPRRTGQLKGALGTRRIGDAALPQWQQELTSAGRLWYCLDKTTRTAWIVMVDLAHPKATD